MHRFDSPEWFKAIKEHLGGASSLVRNGEEQQEMFKGIMELETGESLVFSPSSFVCIKDGVAAKLETGVLKMKTRRGKGVDGGASVLAGHC